jgi:nitroreductase
METIIKALNRRYATGLYDTTRKVSDENLNTILEAMRLAPSSFGLQPWKFIVVTNPDLRAQMKEYSNGQGKVAEASHLIVVASKKTLTENDVDEYMNTISTTRGMPIEALAWFKSMIMGIVNSMDAASMQTWNAKQSYIAVGIGLVAAAEQWIDASPMEWFIPEKINELLGLTDYTANVLIAVWYRSPDEAAQHYAKVRYPMDKIVEHK